MTSRPLPEEAPVVASCSEHATARLIARIASQLFAERGYDATPVRSIAEAAGITCPTLYYHFKSKEGLAHELLTRPLAAVAEAMRSLVEDQGLDPIERLVRMVEVSLAFSQEDPDRARFVYAVMFGPSDRTLAAEVDGFITQFNAYQVAAAERLVEAGIVPPGQGRELATALRGQFVIRAMDYLYRGVILEPDLARRIVLSQLLGMAEPTARDMLLKLYCPRPSHERAAGRNEPGDS